MRQILRSLIRSGSFKTLRFRNKGEEQALHEVWSFMLFTLIEKQGWTKRVPLGNSKVKLFLFRTNTIYYSKLYSIFKVAFDVLMKLTWYTTSIKLFEEDGMRNTFKCFFVNKVNKDDSNWFSSINCWPPFFSHVQWINLQWISCFGTPTGARFED